MKKELKTEKINFLICLVVFFTLFEIFNLLRHSLSSQIMYLPLTEWFKVMVMTGGVIGFCLKKKIGWQILVAVSLYTLYHFLSFFLSTWYIEGLYWGHTVVGFTQVFIDLVKVEWMVLVSLYILIRKDVRAYLFSKGELSFKDTTQTMFWMILLEVSRALPTQL